MTTLLDHIDSRAATDADPGTGDVTAPAQRLRATMAAVRLGFTWLGTQKSLTPEQRAQAAEAFDAEGQFLSAGKKLLDVKHPAFRARRIAKSLFESPDVLERLAKSAAQMIGTGTDGEVFGQAGDEP